ncbi:MAG TPA: PfkB family carbohydrate kinase [Chloroflexota bacterium]|nr:PfkB family carbohydrate kinase [Chloroflexota bacterium]
MIVTLGDLTLDILVKPDKHIPGKPVNSPGSVTMTSGGTAANFAVWVARLGAGARFIGKVGNDPAATLLVWDLLKEGVLPETIAEKGSTPTLTHVVREGGQVELIPDRGVAVRLRPHEVDASWLSDAQWLHIPAPSLLALPIGTAAARAVKLAREAKARVSIDLNSADDIRNYGVGKFSVVLKSIKPDVLFATEEVAALFPAGSLGELATISVLRLREGGAGIADDKGYREFGPEKLRTIDRTGASDAFAAAWCVTFLATKNADQASHKAIKLGARVAARQGTRPEVDLKGIAE